MLTFLNDVILDLKKKSEDFSKFTFILPSKRAGVFLKHCIAQELQKTLFVPKIISIETFVETLSGLNYATNTDLLFQFYNIYVSNTPKELVEPFDTFSKWAQMLLQDFNEIDRYLVPPNHVFDYLNAIKKIEHQHWSLDEHQTDYIKNYLSFWERLKVYYHKLNDELIAQKKGYQGLVYREAIDNIEQFSSVKTDEHFVFVGFNALNKAEEVIIQELLQNHIASIYWDTDIKFVNDPIHDAGLFIRSHKTQWKYFNKAPFNWLHDHYSSDKTINCIGVSKHIGQVKYIGELLSKLKGEHQSLNRTAIVLGDENLLLPLLNSLPENIGPINITMGLPLHAVPMSNLFERLFSIHASNRNTLHYKDVISILSNQFIKPLFNDSSGNLSDDIIYKIQHNNILYISANRLKELSGSKSDHMDLLFSSWNNNPDIALQKCFKLILAIKSSIDNDKKKNKLALEYLYRFNVIFNELIRLNNDFEYINSITTLFGLYKELLKSETLDFQGEPLNGLQIMGMLESRVLDFERVIITSVNEGILPAGKSNSSFIPFDVKLENKMPTYKEKDAVYTYHFYRLLQRAKYIDIIYNTEPDALNGGEKSRFITQLEIDKTHHINHYVVAPKIVTQDSVPVEVIKTEAVLNQLKKLAQKGLSPSSLTNYIRNPIDFYYEKVLGLEQHEEVEENVAFNTLGTIIHNTLEDFYKPLEGEILTTGHLDHMKTQIASTVLKHFEAEYREGDISQGKNLIIFEIAKHYILQFLDLEKHELAQGNEIKIIAIETENKTSITIDGIEFPIVLKGKVDRVDCHKGITRVIDYKSGRVEQGKVEIVNWEDLTTDYDKFSKSFQILMYAYMMHKEHKIELPIEAGIISFKKLNSGLLRFGIKDSERSKSKDNTITTDTLLAFEKELKKLILEIYNPNLSFVEKDVD